MIDKILEKLCDYSDKLHEMGLVEDRKIVQNCIDLIHIAWKESESARERHYKKEPDSELEDFVLSIPNLLLYFDTTDRRYYYELDGWHFDSPREVMRYLVDSRADERAKFAAVARKDALKLINELLRDAKLKVNQHTEPHNAIRGTFKREYVGKKQDGA